MATLADAAGRPLRDVVYTTLRGELMNGDIRFGERLTEPKLSARFGISRTPIREALTVLCSDGLLQREEYGFTAVRPSIPLIRDLYELRITLELGGIQRAIDNPAVTHDHALLTTERAAWLVLRADPPEQEPGFVVRDEEFHVYRVVGSITRVKRERDHDIHIVLKDPEHPRDQLVVELDDPDFGKTAGSPYKDKLTAARQAFDALPARLSVDRLSDLNGLTVRVTGVGFFDLNHLQVGRSRSCIELHPMLAIERLK